MKLKLHIWRQSGPNAKVAMETYEIDGVTEEVAKRAFNRVAHKLPVKCKFVTRDEL